MTDKQKYELFCSEPILHHLGLRNFVHSSDSPDLLIMKNGRMIGVEVVSCYPDEDGNGSYYGLISRIYEVCREYTKKLISDGVKGLFGTVLFTDAAYRIDRSVSTRQFKRIVFEEIERKRIQYQYEEKLNLGENQDDYFTKMVAGFFDCKYVESVTYHDLPDCDIVEFSPVRVGYILPLDAKYVLSCIDKKDKKLFQYKTMLKNKSIGEYWLFISNPSSTFCDLDDFEMPVFETEYDHVFVTDFRKVMQLK